MCDDMNSFGNTAIGYSALSQNKIAGENTAVGFRALSANDNDGKFQANDNTGIGSHALAKT